MCPPGSENLKIVKKQMLEHGGDYYGQQEDRGYRCVTEPETCIFIIMLVL